MLVYYMDFIRFMRRDRYIPNPNVLQIGIGVGISARTTLGNAPTTNLTIIELDPTVYKFARKYFELPETNYRVMDGRRYVEECEAGVYDVVVHDVFTGGEVPRELYSLEMWRQVRRVMKHDGILGVNFVGSLTSKATKSVIKTLRSVFKYVSVYSEPQRDESLRHPDTVRNLVVYASNALPISFRDPSASEVVEVSRMYVEMWNLMEESKVDLQKWFGKRPSGADGKVKGGNGNVGFFWRTEVGKIVKRFLVGVKDEFEDLRDEVWRIVGFGSGKDDGKVEVITDGNNPLRKYQRESSEKHWRMMQELFPTEFWWSF
ncbi:hypothetical protein HK098_000230 [Nowakowskiella sp. JEL0407]|nr:hypothetical protein HK098_000230 [Nowakowskiella sp. JEL0407]